jgi:hypothetical protein
VQIGVTDMDDWTESRITAACTFVRERLEADFAGTDLPAIEFRVDPTWDGSDDDIPSGISLYRPRPEDVIVICGGHEFPLWLGGGVETACWYAAYQLRDDVMGEHNKAWPELRDNEGRFVGVLDTPGSDLGVAQWQLRNEPFCAVGPLHKACEAAGLTIKTLA